MKIQESNREVGEMGAHEEDGGSRRRESAAIFRPKKEKSNLIHLSLPAFFKQTNEIAGENRRPQAAGFRIGEEG